MGMFTQKTAYLSTTQWSKLRRKLNWCRTLRAWSSSCRAPRTQRLRTCKLQVTSASDVYLSLLQSFSHTTILISPHQDVVFHSWVHRAELCRCHTVDPQANCIQLVGQERRRGQCTVRSAQVFFHNPFPPSLLVPAQREKRKETASFKGEKRVHC